MHLELLVEKRHVQILEPGFKLPLHCLMPDHAGHTFPVAMNIADEMARLESLVRGPDPKPVLACVNEYARYRGHVQMNRFQQRHAALSASNGLPTVYPCCHMATAASPRRNPIARLSTRLRWTEERFYRDLVKSWSQSGADRPAKTSSADRTHVRQPFRHYIQSDGPDIRTALSDGLNGLNQPARRGPGRHQAERSRLDRT